MLFHKTENRQRTKRRRGFTLIELMLATTLMMILVAIVLKLTGGILNSWNQGYAQLSANFGARQALDIMASDLEGAIVKSDSLNSAETRNWIEIFRSDNAETYSDFGAFDHIFFFSPTSLRHKEYYNGRDSVPIPGDIAAICYRVAFENPLDPGSDEDRRFVLYRAAIDPDVTFTDFLGENAQKSLSDAWNSSSYEKDLIDEDYERGYGRSGWEYAQETMNLLSLNVVSLQFDPVFKEKSGNSVNFEVDVETENHELPKDSNKNNSTLVAIDISMVVLSEEGEAIIRNLDNGKQLNEARFEEIAYSFDESSGSYKLGLHAERYKRRVMINSSPF